MKQLLFTLLLLLSIAGSANAQVCKISNTNDNVEVFSAYLSSPNQVTVVVSNDSKDISANVTVKVKVTYGTPGYGPIEKEFTGKGLAKPDSTTEIRINIPDQENKKTAQSVQVTGISGTKCIN